MSKLPYENNNNNKKNLASPQWRYQKGSAPGDAGRGGGLCLPTDAHTLSSSVFLSLQSLHSLHKQKVFLIKIMGMILFSSPNILIK